MATYGGGMKLVGKISQITSGNYTVPSGQYLLFNAFGIGNGSSQSSVTVDGAILVSNLTTALSSIAGCVAGPGAVVDVAAAPSGGQAGFSGVLFSN